MKTVGDKLEAFTVVAAKPGFNNHEENGQSAFETVTEASFPGKWKIIYFYPKDFTFVCPTEIVEFAKLTKQFEERDAVLLGGSSDNEFVKLAWRREHKDLDKLNHYSFGDVKGELIDQLGVRDKEAGVALRATFIVDPDNTIQ
ncbi:redoxin domain-containing protein, partial [Burkholderia gladioli]